MTPDRVAEEPPGRGVRRPQGGRAGASHLDRSAVLTLCDRLLGEVGRRGHLFAWLRAPEGDSSEWLPVDAYYPRARLVVRYRTRSGRHDDVYRELVPQHGLRLLELTPARLGDTATESERALTQMLAGLPAPAPAPSRSGDPASAGHGQETRGWRLALNDAAAATRQRLGDERSFNGRAAAGRSGSDRRRSAPQPGASQPGALQSRSPRPRSALERGSRFVSRRRRPGSAVRTESPLVGIVVGLGLVLVLLVAVVFMASAAGS